LNLRDRFRLLFVENYPVGEVTRLIADELDVGCLDQGIENWNGVRIELKSDQMKVIRVSRILA
jgi:hypothetical protein